MECPECCDNLTAYLDGELADSLVERMKRHLEECEACHAEFRDLRESSDFIVRNARALEPVPEIWNNLRSRIAEMPPPGGSFGFFRFLVLNRWKAAVATIAATVVLAVGLWGYLQYQQSQRELASYMSEYIQKRAIQESMHDLRSNGATGNPSSVLQGYPDNPFVNVRPVSFDNPFRSEDR